MKRYTADEIKQFMESAGFGNITIAKKGNLFLLNGERVAANRTLKSEDEEIQGKERYE